MTSVPVTEDIRKAVENAAWNESSHLRGLEYGIRDLQDRLAEKKEELKKQQFKLQGMALYLDAIGAPVPKGAKTWFEYLGVPPVEKQG